MPTQSQKNPQTPEPPTTTYAPNLLRISQTDTTDFTGPTLTLLTGSTSTPITVHKTILCTSSTFFRNASKPEWNESRNPPNTINLQHLETELLNTYIHWLYRKTLAVPIPTDRADYAAYQDGVYPSLARMYVLGEELMDTAFKNTVIDAIIACAKQVRWYPVGEAVKIIYEGTVAGSVGRKVVVDMCAAISVGSEKWVKGFEQCPKEFLLDALTATAKLRPSLREEFWGRGPEFYHEKDVENK